jgi:hydrogenase expression/formation protein HypC
MIEGDMCLAIPARIIELEGDNAVVDAMGNHFKARTTLIPDARLGDLVLVHAGFAIATVDEEEAKKTWELIARIDSFNDTPNRVSG